MIPVLLIRHGPTTWNAARRIQGHTDIPLSNEGRADLARRQLPEEYRGWRWFCSPLRRTRETAALLGASDPSPDPRLAEMRWGEWEGRTLDSLRAEFGEEMATRERLGLDFRAPGGESPREARARLAAWLAEVAAAGEPVIAVTHKGILRAAMSLATGWEYLDKPPVALDWTRAHLFEADVDGGLRLTRPNIDLEVPGP